MFALSVMSSVIALAKGGNGRKPPQADEKAPPSQPQETEGVRHERPYLENRRQTISRTPCLPAKFDPPVGIALKSKTRKHVVVPNVPSSTERLIRSPFSKSRRISSAM